MGKFDDYNRKMVDAEHERWLNPPDEDESIKQCDFCNNPAEYEVMGDYYCECCLHAEFRI